MVNWIRKNTLSLGAAELVLYCIVCVQMSRRCGPGGARSTLSVVWNTKPCSCIERIICLTDAHRIAVSQHRNRGRLFPYNMPHGCAQCTAVRHISRTAPSALRALRRGRRKSPTKNEIKNRASTVPPNLPYQVN